MKEPNAIDQVKLAQLAQQFHDLKVVQLSRPDGGPSNVAILVDERAGDLRGSVLKREDGNPMDCDMREYNYIVNGFDQ